MPQIVMNRTDRVLVVPKPSNNPGPNGVPAYDSVKLMPGSNEVDESLLSFFEKSATARHWIKTRMVEIPKAKKDADGLDGFEPETALQFVQDCIDVELLDRWLDGEKRPEIKKALKSRQKTLIKALER